MSRCNESRRAWLLGLAMLPLLSFSPPSLAESEVRTLQPGTVWTGSRVVQRPNPAGFPNSGMGEMGPLTLFVFPVAVAIASTGEIFLADAGLGTIFRLDPMLGSMRAIGGIRASQQTRLAATPDGSVVVASGSAAPVVRIDRSGRVVQFINQVPGAGTHYDDIAVDPSSGRYYGLDKVQSRLEEVMPHGLGGIVLPNQVVPELPSAMAMAEGRIYLAGRVCQCIVAVDTFGGREVEVVAEDAGHVIAMATGDGWLAALDGRERVLRVWREGALVAENQFAGLGLIDPRGLAIARQTLYIADGSSRRLLSFHLRP